MIEEQKDDKHSESGNDTKPIVMRSALVTPDNYRGMEEWYYWPEGMESEAWTLDGKKSTKIILTIAHLDHDKNNNDYDNLAALCQKCHLGIDLKHHMANARETRNRKKKLQSLF